MGAVCDGGGTRTSAFVLGGVRTFVVLVVVRVAAGRAVELSCEAGLTADAALVQPASLGPAAAVDPSCRAGLLGRRG